MRREGERASVREREKPGPLAPLLIFFFPSPWTCPV